MIFAYILNFTIKIAVIHEKITIGVSMKTIKQAAQKLRYSYSYTYTLLQKFSIKPRRKHNRLYITENQYKKIVSYKKQLQEQSKQRKIIARYKKDLSKVTARRHEIENQVKLQRKTNRALKRIGKRQLNEIKKEMKNHERFCARVIRDCKPDRKTRQTQQMEARYYGY